MSDTPICDHNTYETDPGAEVVPLHIAQQLERENAELKNEIMKMRSIVLTIQVLEYDSHKLKGHECFAKHWALSLLDRVKRLKKGKADE